MLKYILRETIPNNPLDLHDPTRLLRIGYEIDSHFARLKTFCSRESWKFLGFIQFRPEGPRNS